MITKTLPIWIGFGTYLLFSIYLVFDLQVASHQPQSSGPILFWQDGVIYTINPDGTNLQRITAALFAHQRAIEVSPGCHGLAEAGCWVLIGHVLYHITGKGIPLPVTSQTAWTDNPTAWSPDGVHLAYMVSHQETGQTLLFIYNTNTTLAWSVAQDIDATIKPAWSAGCLQSLNHDCYLAYAKHLETGEQGKKIIALNLATQQSRTWQIPSQWGHLLSWSRANQLYVGSRLGWFDIDQGQRVGVIPGEKNNPSLAPNINYVAYTGVISPPNPPGIWLGEIGKSTPQPVFLFPSFNHKAKFNSEVFWSPQGDALATFNQGYLVYYNLKTEQGSILYQTQTLDVLRSYAFSPQGGGITLVEGQYLHHPEKPSQRLIAVEADGQVVTLRTRSESPIVVLAWLPANYQKYIRPTYTGLVAKHNSNRNHTILAFELD